MESLRKYKRLRQSIYVQIRFKDAIVPSHDGLSNLEWPANRDLTGL